MSAGDHDPATSAAFVHAIAEATRELARSTPAPRGMPFFGLDMDVHEPQVLDEFCRQGIFRKYERVLIINSSLGGAARWWAARWGCTVIGTDRSAALARGAAVLSRRAGVHGPTTFVAASAQPVPLLPESVTHVWIRDPSREGEVSVLLRETYRALRPGGHVTADVTQPDLLERLRATASRVGFIAVETHPVAPVSPPYALLTALSQLDAFIARTTNAARRRALPALAAPRRAALEPSPRLQFFAQRPS